jgi:hypothetical protein
MVFRGNDLAVELVRFLLVDRSKDKTAMTFTAKYESASSACKMINLTELPGFDKGVQELLKKIGETFKIEKIPVVKYHSTKPIPYLELN